jgi:hypothetical protein
MRQGKAEIASDCKRIFAKVVRNMTVSELKQSLYNKIRPYAAADPVGRKGPIKRQKIFSSCAPIGPFRPTGFSAIWGGT